MIVLERIKTGTFMLSHTDALQLLRIRWNENSSPWEQQTARWSRTTVSWSSLPFSLAHPLPNWLPANQPYSCQYINWRMVNSTVEDSETFAWCQNRTVRLGPESFYRLIIIVLAEDCPDLGIFYALLIVAIWSKKGRIEESCDADEAYH